MSYSHTVQFTRQGNPRTDGRTVIGMITAVTTPGSGEDGSTSGKGQLFSAGETTNGNYTTVSGAISSLANFDGGGLTWAIPNDSDWETLGAWGSTDLYDLLSALGDKITSVVGKTYYSTNEQGHSGQHHYVEIDTGGHDKDKNNHYGRGIANF